MLAIHLSNAVHLLWQHALYGSLGVDLCLRLKQVRFRDNIAQDLRTELLVLSLYKYASLLLGAPPWSNR